MHLNAYILNHNCITSQFQTSRKRGNDGMTERVSLGRPPIYFEYVLKYAMVNAGVVTDKANRILSSAVNVGINQNAKNSVKNKYMTLFLNMENPTAR